MRGWTWRMLVVPAAACTFLSTMEALPRQVIIVKAKPRSATTPTAPPESAPLPGAGGTLQVKTIPATGSRPEREWMRIRARGLAKSARYGIFVDDPAHPGGVLEPVVEVTTRANGSLNYRMDSKYGDAPGLEYGNGDPKTGLPFGEPLAELAGEAFELRDPGGVVVLRGTVPDCRSYRPPVAWASRSPMPHPRSAAGAAVQDGIVYVVGGWDAWWMASTNDAYDPATDTWTGKAGMPTARQGLGVVAVGGLVYAIGGMDGSGAMATVEAYDPSTDSWSVKAPLLQARYFPAVAVLGGKIYVVGGKAGPDELLDSVEVYDPALGSWSSAVAVPAARACAAAAADGSLHLLGGDDGTAPTGAHDVLDPGTGLWTPAAEMPTARLGLTAAWFAGRLHAIGGMSGGGPEILHGVDEVYDPLAMTWGPGPALRTARCWPASAVVDGRLFVIGGTGSLGVLGSVEALDDD